MPTPLPDINRDHQCYHYQAPTGERCGSPAIKGEYYCYHHLVRAANKKNHRVLIDPEITCMEIPPIEDRASIFIALAAVVHRLAENTIDTRRAGQMIYGLQVAMRALEPPPSQRSRPSPTDRVPRDAAESNFQGVTETNSSTVGEHLSSRSVAEGSASSFCSSKPAPDPPAPKTIPITKESLLYFLRSRHCYNCNAELFPPEELTYRRNAGAPPEVIEEANPRLPAPQPATDNLQPATVLPTLQAVASDPTSNLVPRTSNLAPEMPAIRTRPPALLYTHLGARYPRDLRVQSGAFLLQTSHPHRFFESVEKTGERNGSSR